MITTIAIILLGLAVIGNTISIWYVSNKKESSVSFMSSRPLSEHNSFETKRRIDKLEETLKDAQPLIDKYKKERKQNHWKQYNDWKRLYESKHGRCAQCHGDKLEIDTSYKHRYLGDWLYEPLKEYPESAEYKCNTCGEVISTWEFKEDDQ
ncbi:hypothetical protein BU100_07130 [Staphylococcus xylosus]|uniref:hypothetical protein n=1 Tax=Staphylococcus xylosus TaxID=1288 RepID=UPI000E6A3AB0|nr:hypothetical protein [Staphylococcus xylosus]RIM94769.1 hypothetical protein BU100_07130 [Staphylococcus xylosus]